MGKRSGGRGAALYRDIESIEDSMTIHVHVNINSIRWLWQVSTKCKATIAHVAQHANINVSMWGGM